MDTLKALYSKEIILYSHELNKDIDNCILKKVKLEVENKCIEEGFVMDNSIEIIKKTCGYYSSSTFSGLTKFMVYYKADVINPQNGSLIKCNIKFINKLGIQAESGPLLIIIAKEFHTNKKVFKNKKLGDEIEVIILDKKFNINDKIISVAAKFDENEVTYDEIQLEQDLKNISENIIPISSMNINNDDEDFFTDDEDSSDIMDSSDEEIDDSKDIKIINIKKEDLNLTNSKKKIINKKKSQIKITKSSINDIDLTDDDEKTNNEDDSDEEENEEETNNEEDEEETNNEEDEEETNNEEDEDEEETNNEDEEETNNEEDEEETNNEESESED